MVAVTLIAFWWLPSPEVQTAPVTFVRNADGEWLQEDEQPAGSTFRSAFDAGTLKAHNNLSTSSGTSHSGLTWFASDSVVVINDSSALLAMRAADHFVEQLRANGSFRRLEYYPAGTLPEAGSHRPDLYVTLKLLSCEETGLVTDTTKAKFEVHLGQSLGRNRHSYSGSSSPPLLDHRATFQLDHESNFSGVVSSAAQLRQQGDNIGKFLAEAILKRIESLRDKFPSMPELPESFYPDYQTAPDFEFLQQTPFTLVASTHGAFIRNETFWRSDDMDGAEFLPQISEELLDAGWEESRHDSNAEYLRMTNDHQVLVAFRERINFDAGDTRFWVCYLDALEESARLTAIDQMLQEESPSVATLLALKPMARMDQQSRILQTVEEHGPVSFYGWLAVANHYFAVENQVRAIQALQCAALMQKLQSVESNEVRNLIREHDLDRAAIETITSETLDRVGIPQLTQENPGITVELKEDRIAAVAIYDDGKGWEIDAWIFGELSPGAGNVNCRKIQLFRSSSSWSSSTWFPKQRQEWFSPLMGSDRVLKVRTEHANDALFPNEMTFLLESVGSG